MVATIVLNWICGFVFLIALVFVIPDLAELAALASGQPTPVIILSAVGSPGAAMGLLIPLLVLAIFCGIGCTTAASRCTWAFSRDGAIPGSKWWRQIHPKLDVPLNAMMLSMVIQLLLGLIYFGAPAAFNAFSGVGVICLTTSYAVPIAVSLLGGRKHIKHGQFDMRIVGAISNVVALGKHISTACSLLLANMMQPGLPSLFHFSACHPIFPSLLSSSTMLLLSSLPSSSWLRFGTMCGAASTMLAPQFRTTKLLIDDCLMRTLPKAVFGDVLLLP